MNRLMLGRILSTGLLFTAGAFAADPPAPAKPAAAPAAPAAAPAPAPTPEPGQMTFALMDNSLIAGKLDAQSIAIDTRFGPLKVPIVDLLSFTPGLDSHPDLTGRIGGLIEKLGSMDAAERDQAQAALLAMGPSVKAELAKFTKDADPERQLRVNAILDELANQQDDPDEDSSADKSSLAHLDTIETRDFTIAGKIVPQEFKVVSPYGPLTVKIGDIRRATRSGAPVKEEFRKTVTVDGTNTAQTNPKDTGIKIKRGDKVTITAEGGITLSPWGSENLSPPDGLPNCGWYVPNQIAMGALIGQVGKGGDMFKAGSKYSFKATKAGNLFFSFAISPNYRGNAFPGNYTVKVKIEPQ